MYVILGIFTRIGQAAIEASVTLFIGLLVAAVMRRMLGADGVRRMFGGNNWSGLLRAWGIGTLLPVCSLGVIPIAAEMRRCGVRGGTILAFVLSAPHLNPLSLLYGLTLSEPIVIVCFAIASLLLAVSAGALWDRVFSREDAHQVVGDEPMPTPGAGRLLAVFVSAARNSVSPLMLYVILGILGTGLMSGSIPHGSLSTTMRHDDVRSPWLMAVLALPSFAGPLQGMMKLGLMFEHGNSVGASFVLFELGIGLNLGLIAWEMATFGWRRVFPWLMVVVATTIGLGYLAEQPLYFAHEEASHTHAFDDWSNPFTSNYEAGAREAAAKVGSKIEVLEPVALAGLLLLVVTGATLNRIDPQRRIDQWLCSPKPDKPRSRWDFDVPGPILGFCALAGLVVFSVVALYVYYPPPEQVYAEIGRVRADALIAVKTGNKEEGIRQLELWDLLTRKLQVGVFLRTGKLESDKAALAEDVRERLEEIRDALLADDAAEANRLVPEADAAYRKCRDAFLPASSFAQSSSEAG